MVRRADTRVVGVLSVVSSRGLLKRLVTDRNAAEKATLERFARRKNFGTVCPVVRQCVQHSNPSALWRVTPYSATTVRESSNSSERKLDHGWPESIAAP